MNCILIPPTDEELRLHENNRGSYRKCIFCKKDFKSTGKKDCCWLCSLDFDCDVCGKHVTSKIIPRNTTQKNIDELLKNLEAGTLKDMFVTCGRICSRRKPGPCSSCGKYTDKKDSTGYCSECASKRYIKNRTNAICTGCGKEFKELNMFKLCEKCEKERVEKNKAPGFCVTCGKFKQIRISNGVCMDCKIKDSTERCLPGECRKCGKYVESRNIAKLCSECSDKSKAGNCTMCGNYVEHRSGAGICTDCIKQINIEKTGSGKCIRCGKYSESRSIMCLCSSCEENRQAELHGPGKCSRCGEFVESRSNAGLCYGCIAYINKNITQAAGNCTMCGKYVLERSIYGTCKECTFVNINIPQHRNTEFWDNNLDAELLLEVLLKNDHKNVVYCLCRDDKKIYIGQTKSLKERIYSHVWDKEFNNIIILAEDIEDSQERLIIEDYFCQKYKPEMNFFQGDYYGCSSTEISNMLLLRKSDRYKIQSFLLI